MDGSALEGSRNSRLLSTLAELTTAVLVDAPVDDLLRKLLARAADVLEVALCGIWRYEADAARLRSHLQFERSIGLWTSGSVVTRADAPAYFAALLSAEALPAADARRDPRTSELDAYLERLGVGALLDAPIVIGGGFGGVVCFEHVGAARTWTTDEIRFAIGVTGLVGAVLRDRRTTTEGAARVLVEHRELPCGVVLFDVDGVIRELTPALTRWFPAPEYGWVGAPIGALLGDAVPDRFELLGRITREPVRRRHRAGGRTFDVTFSASVDAIIALIVDVTAAATADTVLRALRTHEALASVAGVDEVRIIPAHEVQPRTAAAAVIAHGVRRIPHGVSIAFPDDASLATADGYLGLPLHRRDGRVGGVLALIHRGPLPDTHRIDELLAAFARIAELELELSSVHREGADQTTLLRTIADNVGDVFWLATWPERRVLYLTPSAEALTGRSVEAIMASGHLRDLVHPDDLKSLEASILRGDTRFDLEQRIVRPDGSFRWARTRAFLLYNADGVADRFAGMSRDVTVEYELRDKLRVAELALASSGRGHEPAEAPVRGARLGGLLGSSPTMRDVFHRLQQAAETDVTLLLTGESGTGKELAAAAVHEMGGRRTRPFVAVNCAAIPEALLESELFGYVKGAFTGASRDKVGLMQSATTGTLFLDEIGDLAPSLQAKLLRALQERTIRRLGDDRLIPIDVRLIGATHRDLKALVAAGQMREDFYYRIRVVEIELPPLRARPDDIPLLASYFAAELGRTQGKPQLVIDTHAMRRLVAYPWPGNVRELRNAIEHASVSARLGNIAVDDLPPELRATPDAGGEVETDDARTEIAAALQRANGNRTEAARLLGISRVTLWKRMRRLGLAVEDAS